MTGRVSLILNSLRSGGAEKQLLWIASEIRRCGLECSILELTAGERTERIEAMVRSAVAGGVTVARAPAGGTLASTCVRLHRHFEKHEPQLVWSWGLRADVLCFVTAVGRKREQRLMSVRSANAKLRRLSVWLQRLVASFCTGVVSNTHAGLRTSGVGQSGTGKRWVLPNAVAGDNCPPIELPVTRPDKLVLVMLGNIKIHTKGYDIAVKLARALRDRGLPFELRIAGRPDEIGRFEEMCRQQDVEAQLRYYGEVSLPEKFLRDGHLFLLLSRFEGMPNTLLEALQVGLPAIATEVGDLRVLKDNGAPFELVPPENVGAVESAILQAWENWPATVARARLGPAWIEANFSEARCREVLRTILHEVGVL